jgi:charged multivesicular body protein 4
LTCREEHLQRKIDGLVEEAKEKLSKGDKKSKPPFFHVLLVLFNKRLFHTNILSFLIIVIDAIFALKRKKLHEEEILKIQNTRMTLETQCLQLESASQTALVVDAMKAGKNALQKHQSELGVDKIENLMDEIQEQIEVSNEINQALAQPVDPLLASDDDLLAELHELQAQELEEDLLKAAPSLAEQTELNMPKVPVSKLPAVVVHEDPEMEELRKLEAEFASS